MEAGGDGGGLGEEVEGESRQTAITSYLQLVVGTMSNNRHIACRPSQQCKTNQEKRIKKVKKDSTVQRDYL